MHSLWKFVRSAAVPQCQYTRAPIIVGVAWRVALLKKVTQGNLAQNTGIVALLVILIGFAKAAGALTQRRTQNGVRVVVCESVHGARIVILLLLWLRCFVALVLTGRPWCRQELY